jgi:eukaryotic-like serine/threonine-protein kinase
MMPRMSGARDPSHPTGGETGRGPTPDGGRFDPTRTLEEPSDVAQPQEPQPGEPFGRYVLLERIGQGGMGLVYSAYDPRLDRRIALKLLRRTEAPDPHARARLLREAQAIARVRHPNVVTVHDTGVVDDRVFIAIRAPRDRHELAQHREHPSDQG